MSDIQDYIEYIIKEHETLTTIPPIHLYMNRINNRLVFKIKVGYKLELKHTRDNEFIWQHKKINRKKQKMEKMYQVLKKLN